MVGLLPETNAAAETDVLLDAWDFKGRPAPRASTGRWGAAAMILGPHLAAHYSPPAGRHLGASKMAVGFIFYFFRSLHRPSHQLRPPRWHADPGLCLAADGHCRRRLAHANADPWLQWRS
jgi:hypothetical protein